MFKASVKRNAVDYEWVKDKNIAILDRVSALSMCINNFLCFYFLDSIDCGGYRRVSLSSIDDGKLWPEFFEYRVDNYY